MPYPSPFTRPAPTLYPSPVSSFVAPPPPVVEPPPLTAPGGDVPSALVQTTAPEFDIPELAWPFRMGQGDLAMVEHDSTEDIRQSILLALHTPKGVRPLAPEVGIEDPTFTEYLDPAQLARDLARMEPRASLKIETEGVNELGQQQLRVHFDEVDIDDQEA